MELATQQSLRYLFFAAILAIILGITMIAYPGGTVSLMAAAFWGLQVIVSSFILLAVIPDTLKLLKSDRKMLAITHLLLGLAAMALVWIFDVRLIYVIVACFFIFAGVTEIGNAFIIPAARYFLLLLGILNVVIGILLLEYPLMLPLLLAWYILFWGVSRFFLSLELRKFFSE